MSKKIIFALITLFLAASINAAIITSPTEPTTPNQPDPILTQILENQGTINEKISKMPTKDEVDKLLALSTTFTTSQIIVYLVIILVVMQVFHWLFFFWLIANHKIPILNNKKEVLP